MNELELTLGWVAKTVGGTLQSGDPALPVGDVLTDSRSLRTGDVFEAAEVLKHLTYLNQLKPLSFREQRMLERSRYLVVSELAAVCRQPECNIEPRVDQAIARACTKHDRRPARTRAAGAASGH